MFSHFHHSPAKFNLHGFSVLFSASEGLQRAMPKRVTIKPTICWCEMGSPKTTEEELTMVTSFVESRVESMIRWGGGWSGGLMDMKWIFCEVKGDVNGIEWGLMGFDWIWSDLLWDSHGIVWRFFWDLMGFKWDFNGIHSQKVDDILMACKWDLVRSTQWNLMGFR